MDEWNEKEPEIVRTVTLRLDEDAVERLKVAMREALAEAFREMADRLTKESSE